MAGAYGKVDPLSVTCNALTLDDNILHREIEKIFYNDFMLVTEEELGESEDNRRAIRFLEESIRFDEDKGMYRVGLPWRWTQN